MKRFIQLTLASIIAVVGLAVMPVATSTVGAINPFSGACGDSGGESSSEGGGGSGEEGGGGVGGSAGEGSESSGGSSSICGAASQDSAQDIIKNVINTILVVLGMIAVVMIVIGGIRYTTSNGDPSSIKGAKDTILYAIVGLVIAILSFAIVNFVLGRFS